MLNKIKEYMSYIKKTNFLRVLAVTPWLIQDRQSQELLRKILRNELFQTFSKKIKKMSVSSYDPSFIGEVYDDVIWFMWLQPIGEAPEFVQENYKYLRRMLGRKLILISEDNVLELTRLPDFIIDKYRSGIISRTHFSDIVRVQLLSVYGGIWIDSTVVVTKTWLDNTPEITLLQQFKPGNEGNYVNVSSWFMKFPKNHPYITQVRDVLFSYWNSENKLFDYFLIHMIMQRVSMDQNNFLGTIYPFDNSIPHYLMLKMRKEIVSADSMQLFIANEGIAKFTNKTRNVTETENYKSLITVLKQMQS